MPLRATPEDENRPFIRLETGTPKAYFQSSLRRISRNRATNRKIPPGSYLSVFASAAIRSSAFWMFGIEFA